MAYLVSLSSDGVEQGFMHSALFSELVRLGLSVPVLLLFRYMFINSKWHLLSVVELCSLTLGFNLITVLPIVYLVPFSITENNIWFDVLQRESVNTSREFDETLVSMFYSYGLQLGWCMFYILSRSFKLRKELEAEQLDIRASLDNAIMSSLANQISPHFLFNSLNNLCSLIAIDPSRSQSAVRSISGLLRYCMETHKREKTSFEEELRFIDNYVEISCLQYEGRLRFVKDVPGEVLGYAVPPMMIQLLIENSIKHGVKNNKRGGDIALKINNLTYFIEIQVTNDGQLPCDDIESRGIGVKNINERLTLIYGDVASFELTQQDKKVMAMIRIPKEKFYESADC